MKKLELQKILPVLQGSILYGANNQLIKNVAMSRYNPIVAHTLIFIVERNPIKLPAKFSKCVIVTSRPEEVKHKGTDTIIVKVDNARQAYWRFIEYYRSLFHFPVIGVTGTSGKTTTKEMIAWMMGERKKVVKTVLSHNGLARNLPYLMQYDDQTHAAVMEMGVSGPNQLLYSARYFQPTIGIITKIGTDHIDEFKSQDAYIREKGNMLKAVGDRGTIILNRDDEYTQRLNVSNFRGKIIYFGEHPKADFRGQDIHFNHARKGMNFTLVHHGKHHECFVPGFGTHNVYNALAALAAVHIAGIPLSEAIYQLQSFRHVKSHLELHNGINNSLVIDDTWNSNGVSAEAALEVLKEVGAGKRKIAVFGDMAELGDYAVKEHEKIAELVVKYKIDMLITIGETANHISDRAIEIGMNPANVYHVKSKKMLLELIRKAAVPYSVILMKTSMRSSFDKFMKTILGKQTKRKPKRR